MNPQFGKDRPYSDIRYKKAKLLHVGDQFGDFWLLPNTNSILARRSIINRNRPTEMSQVHYHFPGSSFDASLQSDLMSKIDNDKVEYQLSINGNAKSDRLIPWAFVTGDYNGRTGVLRKVSASVSPYGGTKLVVASSPYVSFDLDSSRLSLQDILDGTVDPWSYQAKDVEKPVFSEGYLEFGFRYEQVTDDSYIIFKMKGPSFNLKSKLPMELWPNVHQDMFSYTTFAWAEKIELLESGSSIQLNYQ